MAESELCRVAAGVLLRKPEGDLQVAQRRLRASDSDRAKTETVNGGNFVQP